MGASRRASSRKGDRFLPLRLRQQTTPDKNRGEHVLIIQCKCTARFPFCADGVARSEQKATVLPMTERVVRSQFDGTLKSAAGTRHIGWSQQDRQLHVILGLIGSQAKRRLQSQARPVVLAYFHADIRQHGPGFRVFRIEPHRLFQGVAGRESGSVA